MANISHSEQANAEARAALAESELLKQAILCEMPSEAAQGAVDRALARRNGWRELGDLMGDALIVAAKQSGLGYYGAQSIERGIEEMRAELGFEQSTLAERLLIEQVLLCWLRLGVLERAQTRAMRGEQSIAYLTYLEAATTLAQKRYTNALTALARVRRLMQPRGRVKAVNRPDEITLPAGDVRQLEG